MWGLASDTPSTDGKPRQVFGGLHLSREDFTALKELCFEDEAGGDNLSHVFRPSLWNHKEALQAQSHVGVIITPSGCSIEILPKIATVDDSDLYAQDVLLRMLRTLPDSPFRAFEQASLAVNRLPLLEVFILCFLREVTHVIKHGIASDYVAIDENSNVLRGRLVTHEHIRHNAVRRERAVFD